MNACLEDVIEHIKPHLLSDIVIKTDKKVLKKGKLMIFQVKQHYLRLMIEIAGKTIIEHIIKIYLKQSYNDFYILILFL